MTFPEKYVYLVIKYVPVILNRNFCMTSLFLKKGKKEMCSLQKKKSLFSAIMLSTLLVSQAAPMHAITLNNARLVKTGAITLFCALFYINFKDTFGTDVKTDIYRWVNKLRGDKSIFHALWNNLFKRAQRYKDAKVRTTPSNELICSEFKPAQGAGIPLLFLDVFAKTIKDFSKYFASFGSLILLLQTGDPQEVASSLK